MSQSSIVAKRSDRATVLGKVAGVGVALVSPDGIEGGATLASLAEAEGAGVAVISLDGAEDARLVLVMMVLLN